MDRKTARGPRPKTHPPKDLFALGSKSSGSGSNAPRSSPALSSLGSSGSSDSGQSQMIHEKSGLSISFAKQSDRKREAANIIGKKASVVKSTFSTSAAINRHGPSKLIKSDSAEGWESVAEVIEVEDLYGFLESAEEREDLDRIEAYLCGSVKVLRTQRMAKPDNLLCLTLTHLAKTKPFLFNSSPLIIDAFCSLLRKSDFGMAFKTKSNPSASLLAVNLLLAIFQDEKCWPEVFIRVYIDDSLGERLWVDHEESKGLVENIISSFKTKLPPKSSSLYPDTSLNPRPDCPSPPVASMSAEMTDGDSEFSLECKETFDVTVFNRYTHMTSEIEELVIETVHNQLNVRHQNLDAVARNFIRFLSSVTGISEVRRIIAPKLETWLQNHKHQRPAVELLMSLCMNCNTHSVTDQKVIAHIVHIRLKLKPLTNQYLSCLKELLAAHPSNIASVIKETTFNELSPTRNLSNMAILSVAFQFSPDLSAAILADIFIELLRNAEDFLRALRALFREIVRSLRHDLQYVKFCQGLLKDQKDSTFKDNFEFKERMFHSIVDLAVMSMFASISPQIRDAANAMYRGENRDTELVKRYQEMVSFVQQDVLYWMYRIAPKTYLPSKDEFIKSLHKLFMMDQPEVYYHKDNWPMEGDRPLFFRLASEVPFRQESLHRLLVIGTMKEQYLKPQDVLELTDKIIKRATLPLASNADMLLIEDIKLIELLFTLTSYVPPENSPLPLGYRSPKTAIANLYWKSWIMLLLITAHNPSIFGVLAWETYPTVRVMMEICITNTFQFPPPTMSVGDKAEEMNNHELMIIARERQQILEFESHLAQKTITEQNSLLLSQLITMDVSGPARKPPPIVMEQLKTLNSSHKIGHLLCRCRKPDFLVDIIQRQGAPQSMPWLAQLVESSEDAFSILPVQCLCEFLLSETVSNSGGVIMTHHQQLLQHLRCLLLSPKPGQDSSVEILEYFLRRLSSQQVEARTQAVGGLQLVVGPLTETMEVDSDKHEPYKWLLKHLPALPGFPLIKSGACQALRAACMIETKPAAVSAYIRFLAVHTCEDSLQETSALVQDMAQLIVERSTMISAILPSTTHTGPHKFTHAVSTLNALFIIFINYMHGVRIPADEMISSVENQDHVRIQWTTGEQAVMHILVVHAMVILLIYGPCANAEFFHQLLHIWFPRNQEMPQAFLVDTAQEALLLPDWLKLKMIRSVVQDLVDAALKDLEPSQLVLFIQSFGIPVQSMTKLLCALDLAVRTNEEAVAAAVLDKSHKNYMAQLIEVQHQRGAKGGLAFAATLGDRDDFDTPSDPKAPFMPLVTPLMPSPSVSIDLSKDEIQSFILQCFTSTSLHTDHRSQVRATMRSLCHHLSREISSGAQSDKVYLAELIKSFSAILQSQHALSFIKGLYQFHSLSTSLFRMLFLMKDRTECEQAFALSAQIVLAIQRIYTDSDSPLTATFASFSVPSKGSSSSTVVMVEDISSPQSILDKFSRCPLVDMERLLREMVECAMREKKIGIIVEALVLIITRALSEPNSLFSGQHIPLLMDWLRVFDPELSFVPFSQSKFLLFGCPNSPDLKPYDLTETSFVDQIGNSRAYLLASYTHEASWPTLESVVRELLKFTYNELNPTSILDFIWAVLHVPKLWQGRERRSPRHVKTKMPLVLLPEEQICLTQYILNECESALRDKEPSFLTEKRINLLFSCSPNISYDLRNIVNYLNTASTVKKENVSNSTNASHYLLYQMYLKRPCIIRHLSNSSLNALTEVQEGVAIQANSVADVYLHTLITMLTSPLPGKEFVKRMQDIESAVRKMASKHPLLVLRHLSFLASSLQGLTHFHWSVIHYKNYAELFHMVMGILELLRPFIFRRKYAESFAKTLNIYMDLFKEHGRIRELGSLILRVCQLLMGWIGTKFGSAYSYVSDHASLLSSLLETHPDMLPLRSLAAIAVSKGSDHPKGEKLSLNYEVSSLSYDDFTFPDWFQSQIDEILVQSESCRVVEDQADIIRKIQDMSEPFNGRALSSFLFILSDGTLSRDSENRRKSWHLLAQMVKKSPKMASQTFQTVLSALKSTDVSVASTAVKNLPRVILLLHEYVTELLSAAFDVCILSEPDLTNNLSEALFLLTIHTG